MSSPSPWRSLKDDPPNTLDRDHWRPILLRTEVIEPELTRNYAVQRADIAKIEARSDRRPSFTEWMEIPP